MAKDFDWMEDSNRSANPSIHEVSDLVLVPGCRAADPPRRTISWPGPGFGPAP
jgi:hypothetical protein